MEKQAKGKIAFETVDLPLTVKLPTPYAEFLQKFAKMFNKTVEDVLKDELYASLESFCTGGALENWIDNYLFSDYTIGDKGKQLEDMLKEIDC